METQSVQAPFWDHVEELRKTLIRCFAIIAVGIAISFCFYDQVLGILKAPLEKISPQHGLKRTLVKDERLANAGSTPIRYLLPDNAELAASSSGIEYTDANTVMIPPRGFVEIRTFHSPGALVLLSPTEGMLIAFRVCLWTGVALAAPFWAFFLLRFIAPALSLQSQKHLFPFMTLSFLFLALAIWFTFKVTLPIANQYLYRFNDSLGINFWTLSHYVSYTLSLLIANICCFESFAILLFLVHLGKIQAKSLTEKRRIVITGAFIVGAVLTPPDILTQFMLAIPLVLLYELAILYAKLRQTHKKREDALSVEARNFMT